MSNIIPTPLKTTDPKILQIHGAKDVTVRLRPGQKLLVIEDDAYYSMGEPMDDTVLGGYILTKASKVTWDSLEQKWMDV